MFSNFLYFLIALVIYTSSELFDKSEAFESSGLYYSLCLGVLFAFVCHYSFKRIAKGSGRISHAAMDHSVNTNISRLTMLALVLFSANIYLFRLDDIFSAILLFKLVPTLEAVLFLGLFLLYLVLVWNAAYGVQKQYFPGELTKRNFVLSNVSFSLPALLPWFCLSLFADLLQFLPYEPLKAFLKTPAGEVGYIMVFLVAVSIFGPVLIKKLWNCSSLEPGYSRARIENVCARAGLRYADILKWELFGGSMITAGVMGLVGRFRYILVTTALLNSLDDDEIDAVILHETGHVQKHHMLFYLLFFSGFIACNFVLFEPMMLLLYVAGPVYKGFSLLGIEKGDAYPVLICIGLISFFVVYFRYGFGFFMRNFERQADIHVYEFSNDASAMISTFYKIARLSRQSIDKPNWHHFGIGERIRFLEKCQADPGAISRHHRKVKHYMAWYCLFIIMVFGAGYSINYGHAKDGFENFIAEKILFQQLDVDPDNSDLYVFVGDYHYNNKAYEKAVGAYENVIRIDQKNIHALNNLAWLLVTCPDTRFQNHEKALELALKALAIKREAFILDTYAEALYVNKRFEEAVKAAKEALAITDSKKSYYQKQLQRFEKMGSDA